MSTSSSRPPEEVGVLVVGGSMVGLSTAMFLGAHGVGALVVERHAGTAIHPRAAHFHLRTLELLRSVGLEEPFRRASAERYDPDSGINAVVSLAGEEIANYIPNLNAGVERYSPTVRAFLTQDTLEPLLRERAEQLGATLRYATEVVALEQDGDGVTAHVRDLDRGVDAEIRARYVVAADGNRSPIRTRLGIAMRGHGLLSRSVTIHYRADLSELLRDRNQGVIYITNDTLRGFMRPQRTGDAGFLVVNTVGPPDAPRSDVSPGFTERDAVRLLRAAIGDPDVAVQVTDIAPWEAVADNAERYRDGRILLAGDAAHTVPPNGGFGGNTGLHDAHNVAWKLAHVLDGRAGEGLLDTYDAERRPIGGLTVEQAYARYVTRTAPELGTDGMQPLVDDLTLEIGYRYESDAVVLGDGDAVGLHEHPDTARGRPGSRAPHVVLADGSSTLDLFGRAFVLLAAPGGGDWCDAARAAGAELGLTVDAHRVDVPGFAEAYGLQDGGAALVRPDGVVGWRAAAGEAASAGRAGTVLAAIVDRPAPTRA
jgi:2-polyprenyl-6-methoxyphenol hydroxylase-like FAD-dependent oxidoreductase